jgi:hypothetical protein
LHTFLSVLIDKRSQVSEVAEGRVVPARLGADGRRLANLRDDNADLPGRHLNPRMLCDSEERFELETHAGHEKVSLVTGFAQECDGVVARQLAAKPFSHEPDLGGANAVKRHEDRCKNEQHNNNEK